ncbi:hypothetical protein Ancab_021887 [Ancistrocladus abbreviatus]
MDSNKTNEEMTSSFVSTLSSSGIKALPSRDDSDSETVLNYSENKIIENKINNTNSECSSSSSSVSSGGSSNSANDDIDNDDERFVSGEEDVETLSERLRFVSSDEIDPPFFTPRAAAPRAKLSEEEEEDDDDDNGGVVVGGEDVDRSYVVEKAPKVRVLDSEEVKEGGFGSGMVVDSGVEGSNSGEEEVKVGEKLDILSSNLGDQGAVVDPKGEAVEGIKCDVDGGANSDMGSYGIIEVNGVKYTNEGDSVVDAIKVDAVEAIRSGAIVVGEKDESKELGINAINPSPVEGRDQSKVALMEGAEALPVKESDSAESETVEDDGVELSSDRIDVVESVRSGAAVAGEVDENKVFGVKVIEPSVVEEHSTVRMGTSAVGEQTENLSVGESGPAKDAVEVGGVKFTGDGDSVVEAVHADPIEAIRSGAAVVGEANEVKDSEVKVMGIPADDSLKLVNDYEVLAGSNSNEVLAGSNSNEAADNKVLAGSNSNEAAGRDASVLSASKDEDSNKVNADTLQKEAELLGPTEDEDKRETFVADTQNEPLMKMYGDTDVMQFVSGRDGQKIQQVEHVNDELTDKISDEPHLQEELVEQKVLTRGRQVEAEDDEDELEEGGEVEGSGMDGQTDGMVFGNSAAARQFMEELVKDSGSGSHSGAGSSHEHSQRIDGQIVTDSDEEADSDEEEGGKELFDSAALAALLKAAANSNSDSGTVTITSQDGSRLFTVERPAGLVPPLRSVRPPSRPENSSLLNPLRHTAAPEENLSEEERKKMEKMQELRVKFLRLVRRLGHSAEDSVAGQVMYRLALLAGRPANPAFSLDNAKQTAVRLESEGKDDLDFSLNILVIGKPGVGKSATINSIFGEEKVRIDAFEPGTDSVTEINGVVGGVKIRVFDTPGLKSCGMEQGYNRKALASVKKFTNKNSPDVVLYVDRLDSQTRDLNDLPLLRTITGSLGSSVWKNAIVTLTHAGCAPPDGPSGSPLSYEVFVAQRSHLVQQSIGQAVGDLRLMNPSLMSPVSLVENHPACRKNREGQKVLPNGLAWRPQLLLLCYSLKILSEANSIYKPQDSFDHRRLFGLRVRAPPLPYLLSSLLQPRTHPKLSVDQGGDNGDSDIDVADFSESDGEEEEDEYDQLPPFKPLRKSQIAKLSKEQRRAYFEEYDYRVKLLQRRQWKEELKRMRQMKKNGKSDADDFVQVPEDLDQENGAPTNVSVPLPDMVLPPSFDCDNPGYRYRFLEPTSRFLARPVLDTHGWDHDCGYDGVNIEQNLGIAGCFPASVVVQITKDKKEFNIHLDSSISAKHGENGSSLAGFDIQTIGKQFAYILRGESKFKNLKKNKTAAGVSVTFLGENVATGVKVEDQLAVGKRVVLVGSTGAIKSQKDAAYGANLEIRLRDADYPIGQDQSSFVLSLMKWRGDLALGANFQSQFSVGRNSKMAVRIALNNKLSGQISVRTSSSDHLQLALAGLIPIAIGIYRSIKPSISESYSIY